MSIDLKQAWEDDRKRRLAGAAPQINDANNNAGRFGLNERRQNENDARVREARIAQFTDFYQRKFGHAPSIGEVESYLGEARPVEETFRPDGAA
jgi:hypothetical protein